MIGKQIDYELRKGMSSRFNQKMFGRICTRMVDEKKYSYYVPGVLDNVPHFRIFEGRIFVNTSLNIDFNPIMKYCNKFNISTSNKDEDELFIRTARQKWRFHAREREIEVDKL